MTDEEMRLSAEYFAAIKWTPWIRVVESDTVPKTRIVGNLFLATENERTEPIAGRIIEVPEDIEQAETLRNPRSGFVAYVPPGSVEKGRDLVTTGGMRIVGNEIIQGKTTPCVTCHGLDLMGVADVPPIAGRSPSYIARQVWDIQQGTRNGAAVQLMKQAIVESEWRGFGVDRGVRLVTRAAARAQVDACLELKYEVRKSSCRPGASVAR